MNYFSTRNAASTAPFHKPSQLLSIFLIILPFLCVPLLAQTAVEETAPAAVEPAPPPSLTATQIEKIEAFVQEQMTKGIIPGMSLVIVGGDRTLYEHGFGLADIDTKEPVTPTTLFELGSCSKAFTGLALLQLEQKGRLSLNDNLEKHLPWLKMKHRGEAVPVTIAHCLYQTSGISRHTIGRIPVSEADDALEKTVRTLVGFELLSTPGSTFHYATLNYDVLGLIIQTVSGKPYETYIREHILDPLDMKQTFLFRREAESRGMSVGYKLSFRKASAYDAPIYRGNTPAGYIISSGRDLARWLKVQLGALRAVGFDPAVLEKSHLGNPQLPDSNYAAGWFIFPHQDLLLHFGGNPNFSSFVAFAPGSDIGVALLANSSTTIVTGAGRGIMSILRGETPGPVYTGLNIQFDGVALKVVLLSAPFIFLALVLLLRSFIKISREKRGFRFSGFLRVTGAVFATALPVGLCYALSILPSLFNYNVPLTTAMVWLPFSFTYAVTALFSVGFLYYLLILSKLLFPPHAAHAPSS